MNIKLDILAFGAHPDDVELGCGGVLALEASKNKKTGIIDLTRGELGTRGTVAKREKESAHAAEILGVSVRENLNFEDGFFQNDKKNQLQVINIIRKYQPEIVITTATNDRHPDHGRACSLVTDSCFLSGLQKIEPDIQKPWRPKAIYHYIQFRIETKPDFIVDISDFFEIKMKAIHAHKSQFYNPASKEPKTMISDKGFLELIRARAREYGQQIGVRYGEGFNASRFIGVKDISSLI